MKTLTRISLDELAKTMPIVSEEEQNSYIGGVASDRYKKSCIYYSFDYLDGNRHDHVYYADTAYKELGISPDASGNISLSYVAAIGKIGGFDVVYASGENKQRIDPKTGLTPDGGNALIVIVNEDRTTSHMVQVTKVKYKENGDVEYYKYYDATTKEDGKVDIGDVTDTFYVSEKEDSSGGSTDKPLPSGSIGN